MATSSVYSKTFYSAYNLAAGTYSSSAVPTGYVWVIKEVLAYFGSPAGSISPYFAAQGLRVYITGPGPTIFRTPAMEGRAGVVYSAEMRVVLSAAQGLSIVVTDGGWDCIISGYQLTLP